MRSRRRRYNNRCSLCLLPLSSTQRILLFACVAAADCQVLLFVGRLGVLLTDCSRTTRSWTKDTTTTTVVVTMATQWWTSFPPLHLIISTWWREIIWNIWDMAELVHRRACTAWPCTFISATSSTSSFSSGPRRPAPVSSHEFGAVDDCCTRFPAVLFSIGISFFSLCFVLLPTPTLQP